MTLTLQDGLIVLVIAMVACELRDFIYALLGHPLQHTRHSTDEKEEE